MHPDPSAAIPPVATDSHHARPDTAYLILLALAAAKLAFHLLTANRYGIFRDEMYGLACAEHLAWGYPDHPPGGIVMTWLARHLFGDSVFGLRVLPAVAGAALVWMTGFTARQLGGGKFAQTVAAGAVCLVPVYLIAHHWLMMNAFEPLLWLGCVWCVLRVIQTGNPRTWLWFGLLAGVGIEFKYSMVFLIAGVLFGLAITPQRRLLTSPWLFVGLVIAGVLALPNFLWQAANGFPFLELMHNIKAAGRDVVRGPIAFVVDQAMIMQPVLAPLWLGGVAWLLFGGGRRHYAVFGWAFVFVIGTLIVLHGKNYYATPAYPILFAAGAVAFERLVAGVVGLWVRAAYCTAALIAGVALVPYAAPVLPPAAYVRYQEKLGMKPSAFEHQRTGPLPQWFADEFGWEELVREVARIYHALPPGERARTAIFSNSWGDAAAVDYYGPRYGLPKAICKQNSYWYWGPRGYTGEIVIMLHSDGRHDPEYFRTVEKVGRVEHPYSRRDEWFDIYLCRGLRQDFHDLWPAIKLLD